MKECLESAIRFLTMRPHSRAELLRKLRRQKWPEADIESALTELTRVGYLDDRRFAVAKAQSAAKHKKHGRRRAFMELRRAGVSSEVADEALTKVYAETDPAAIARDLIEKHAPRLRRLDPQVARRRLVGMLQRRGFDYETVRPIIDEILKSTDDME
jgi:regulatory protein